MNGKNKKTGRLLMIIVIAILLFTNAGTGYLYYETVSRSEAKILVYQGFYEENERLLSAVQEYKRENARLLESIATLENETETLKSGVAVPQPPGSSEVTEHIYTQTFRYIEDYEYSGEAPSVRHIVVDQFQAFNPTIIPVNTGRFDVDFIKDHFYEITFRTFISGKGTSDKVEIIKIIETEKVAFEQVQEPGHLS